MPSPIGSSLPGAQKSARGPPPRHVLQNDIGQAVVYTGIEYRGDVPVHQPPGRLGFVEEEPLVVFSGPGQARRSGRAILTATSRSMRASCPR